MSLIDVIRKFAYGPKTDSSSYVAYLRSLGMVIGENTTIYVPTKCQIDTTRPWMIEIGRNVSITEGVTILTHGYDWSVFKGKYGDVLGSAGHVRIGDNVFIGMNSTILKGVEIGDNVVIGAGSVVTKSIPPDSVAVGNPCCVIADIDSYLEKRRAAQVDEAADLYDCWRRNSPEARCGGGASQRDICGVFLAVRAERKGRLLGPVLRSDAEAARVVRPKPGPFRVHGTSLCQLRGVSVGTREALPTLRRAAWRYGC